MSHRPGFEYARRSQSVESVYRRPSLLRQESLVLLLLQFIRSQLWRSLASCPVLSSTPLSIIHSSSQELWSFPQVSLSNYVSIAARFFRSQKKPEGISNIGLRFFQNEHRLFKVNYMQYLSNVFFFFSKNLSRKVHLQVRWRSYSVNFYYETSQQSINLKQVELFLETDHFESRFKQSLWHLLSLWFFFTVSTAADIRTHLPSSKESICFQRLR